MSKQVSFLESLRASKLIPLNIQLFSGDDNNDGDGNDENEDEENEDEDEPPKTFTQEEVNKMMAREKRQGKRSAYKELGLDEKTGKSELDEFQKWKREQSKKDEDNNKKQVDEAEKAKAEAEAKVTHLERKAIALESGVKRDMVEDFLALAGAKVDDENDFEDVVELMRKKYKSFFVKQVEQDEDDEETNKAKGTGSNAKSKKKKAIENSLGKRLAESKKTSGGDSNSYFAK